MRGTSCFVRIRIVSIVQAGVITFQCKRLFIRGDSRAHVLTRER